MKYTADNLFKEYVAAKRYWGAAARDAKTVARKAAGDMYWSGNGVANPENYYATHTLHTKARLTSGTLNPRFNTKRQDQSERVEQLESFCSQWIKDTGFVYEFERVVDDMCNGGAVVLVRQGVRKGYENVQSDDRPYTPTGHCLPISMWGCDPLSAKYESARYVYHECVEQHDDLIALAESDPENWDLESVKRMKTEDVSPLRDTSITGVQRKEVSYVVMWCPFVTLPDDDPAWKGVEDKSQYHGTIFKFAVCKPNSVMGFLRSGSPEFLGPPRPYFGPRQGPYVYDGFIDVPGEVRKSSPLIVNAGQIEQYNQHERGSDLIESRAKTVFAFDGMNPDAGNVLMNAQHGDAVALPGLNTQYSTTIDFPGITPDKRARGLELGARVRRNLMMPDTALGEASGAATLGENQIADSHLSMVTEYLDRRARRLVSQVLLRVAWYAENDSRTVSQYDGNILIGGRTRADVEQGIQRAMNARMIGEEDRAEMIAGLPEDGAEVLSFDDLDINVERVKQDGESRAAFVQATEWLTAIAPMVPMLAQMAPGFSKLMDRAADEFGISELATLFDMEAAAEMPVDGQEEAPREMAAEKPQQQMRSLPAQSARSAVNKPDAQAAKLRSKGA